MKKNTNNTITNNTNNNTINANTKEDKTMKKNNVNTNTTNTNNATNTNTLTLAGVQINLTAEQAATIAAMLLGGTAPTAPKKARSKKAVSEAVSADIVKAENVSEDVTAAKTPSTDQLTDQYTDFKVVQDANKLSFKTANGGFLYKKTPRYALNNRIKAVCADKGLSVEYSNDCWAWVVLNPRTGKAPGKSVMTGIVNALSRPIEEHELQAVRDDWAAKKAAKAAK